LRRLCRRGGRGGAAPSRSPGVFQTEEVAMGDRVYLDWNATAPLRAEARAAMVAAMDVVGNPSSVHGEGRTAKLLIERARSQIAALCGCAPQQIVFTSGATEATALAFAQHGHVSAGATEHDAVLAWGDRELGVDRDGQIPGLWDFDGEIEASDNGLVALQVANGETGVLQRQVEWTGRDLLFQDATQAVGKVPYAYSWSGATYACLSAHKIGGPKGIGALITSVDLSAPLNRGGGQEMGRRSGTENVIGIAGFGAAAEAAARDLSDGVWERVAELRKILENALEAEAPGTILIGKDAPRLPNTSCFATPGWKGETQVMSMDLAGFAVSAGSACSSGKVRASRVLTAMGFDDVTAASAIRVSMGPTTTRDEVLRFVDAWTAQEKKFRQRAA